MSVDRIPGATFASDAERARRSAIAKIKIVMEHMPALKRIDPTGKMQKAARSFHTLLMNGESLTPPQYSFLDNITDKTVGAAYNVESAGVHKDMKRKGLRYGS